MDHMTDLFKKFKNNCRVFVETGTFTGNGIQRAFDAGFETIYSCDINKKAVLKAYEYAIFGNVIAFWC